MVILSHLAGKVGEKHFARISFFFQPLQAPVGNSQVWNQFGVLQGLVSREGEEEPLYLPAVRGKHGRSRADARYLGEDNTQI